LISRKTANRKVGNFLTPKLKEIFIIVQNLT